MRKCSELERRGHKIVLASLYLPKTPLRHEISGETPGTDSLRASVARSRQAGAKSKIYRSLAQGARNQARRQIRRRIQGGVTGAERAFLSSSLSANACLIFMFTSRTAPPHTAMFVKAISGIPFSITAHGQDFMSDLGNDELLRELCASAEFVGARLTSRDMLAARCPESRDENLSCL